MGNDFNLFVQQVHGQVQTDGPHVCLLERGRDVHVDVEEPLHHATFLSLEWKTLNVIAGHDNVHVNVKESLHHAAFLSLE